MEEAEIPKKTRGRKRKSTVNKAAKIREAARKIVDSGLPPRPVEIVEALAKEGVRVLSSQVSMALRGTGMELRPKATRRKFNLPNLNDAMDQVEAEDLVAAKEVVVRFGTIEKAVAALVTLSHLGGKIRTENTTTQGEES